MTDTLIRSSQLRGLYQLSLEERRQRLVDANVLNDADLRLLRDIVSTDISTLSDQLIENALGAFPLPFGVVPGFIIDGQERIIPLAVEETSIIAALSKTAKWIAEQGKITTNIVGHTRLGQIYFPQIRQDISIFMARIAQHKQTLIAHINATLARGLVARGGGVQDLEVRPLLSTPDEMHVVIHVLVDTCDAMGANIITQICEALRAPIESLTGEHANMGIVSNLSDTQITQATLVMEGIDPDLGKRLEHASRFAELDPYRATTSNKGVMNGVDAVLIATGNDWRAVEAAVHAYAARHGQYRSITRWRYQNTQLIGTLEAPIATGCVGGMTKLHPLAQLSLRLLQVTDAKNLSRIVAAVGLAQNLAALQALVGDGIVKGHMRLHIKNLMLAAGAQPDEQEKLKPLLELHLASQQVITLGDVTQALQHMRNVVP